MKWKVEMKLIERVVVYMEREREVKKMSWLCRDDGDMDVDG